MTAELSTMEDQIATERDLLSRSKRARDRLTRDNAKLKEEAGMLGNTDMLRSFERHQVGIEQGVCVCARTLAALALQCLCDPSLININFVMPRLYKT